MVHRCAWCQKILGEVPPFNDTRTTDGICPDCVQIYFPKKGAAK